VAITPESDNNISRQWIDDPMNFLQFGQGPFGSRRVRGDKGDAVQFHQAAALTIGEGRSMRAIP